MFRRVAFTSLLLGGCTDASLAVHELRGALPGPTVALVAGVHGGKRSAMRALAELREELERERARDRMHGTVLLVPVAHEAARAGDLAQLSPLDSLNLNRVFPGRADGRPTERLAHRIMTEIVARSDYLVDLHGADGEEMVGAFAYAARPGLDPRVDSAALHLAQVWGTPRVVWDTEGPRALATARFLQTAAHLSGVPAITVFEAGTSREDTAAVTAFKRGARRLLAGLGVLAEETGTPPAPVLHPRRDVVLAEAPGRWSPALLPGAVASAGELIGTLVGSSGEPSELRAAGAGVVLHIRLAGTVPQGTAVAILAAQP
jgi:predicted deacylase